MNKKTVLVLDDEDVLGGILRRHISKRIAIVAPALFNTRGEIDLRRLGDAFAQRPNLVLLDVVWQSRKTDTPGRVRNVIQILKRVFDARPLQSPIKCCLVTAYRKDESDQKIMADAFHKTLGAYLKIVGTISKPMTDSGSAQLAASIKAILGATTNQVTFGIDDIRLPSRILNKDYQVESKNENWAWEQDRPPPRLLGQDREFVIPDSRDNEAGRRQRPTRGSYLKEYRLTEVPLPNRRKLQFALPISSGQGLNRDQLLQQIFELLNPAGFTRMRFFQRVRVPGCEGLLALKRWFPANSIPDPPASSEWRYPLNGVLLRQIEQYQYTQGPEKLVYDIASRQDEMTEDATTDGGLKFWNGVMKADRLTHWLRLPILCRYEDLQPNEFRARGLLVLDKFGARNETIDHDEIEKQSRSLIASCRHLSRVLQTEYDRESRDSIDGMFKFYRSTIATISAQDQPAEFQRAFLDFACACTQAQEGKLYLTSNPEKAPLSVAVYPATRELIRENAAINTDRNPVASRAWREKQEVFSPCFRGGRIQESRIAFPLQIGIQTFGILALRHGECFHFNHRRVAALRRLIDFFVFPLRLAGEHQERRLWEISLAHSFKETNAQLRQEHARLSEIAAVRSSRAYKTMQAAILRLRDISTGFIDLAMKDDVNSAESEGLISAHATLVEAIGFAEMMKTNKHTLDMNNDPCPASLRARKGHFEFILRTLLHNALRHGTDGCISIRTELVDGHWVLKLTNPGVMSDEIFANLFTLKIRQIQDDQEGARVGLAAAFLWTEHYGAKLHADREGGRICFTLEWPIAVPTGAN